MSKERIICIVGAPLVGALSLELRKGNNRQGRHKTCPCERFTIRDIGLVQQFWYDRCVSIFVIVN